VTVDCIIEDARWAEAGLAALAARAEAAALAHLGLDPDDWEIALLGCDDARISVLNRDFRGRAAPTNVLSWPSADRAPAEPGGPPVAPVAGGDPELGDIAIAYETCAREADAGGLAFGDHVTHLVVHGILHLLGHDHVDDRDAARMQGIETEILATMGIADPY
jgi:probable rRNA maturation factor